MDKELEQIFEKIECWLDKTNKQIEAFDALAERLHKMILRVDIILNRDQDQQQPEWLSEALNQGDGVYRP